jgi:hypothetical protein
VRKPGGGIRAWRHVRLCFGFASWACLEQTAATMNLGSDLAGSGGRPVLRKQASIYHGGRRRHTEGLGEEGKSPDKSACFRRLPLRFAVRDDSTFCTRPPCRGAETTFPVETRQPPVSPDSVRTKLIRVGWVARSSQQRPTACTRAATLLRGPPCASVVLRGKIFASGVAPVRTIGSERPIFFAMMLAAMTTLERP